MMAATSNLSNRQRMTESKVRLVYIESQVSQDFIAKLYVKNPHDIKGGSWRGRKSSTMPAITALVGLRQDEWI